MSSAGKKTIKDFGYGFNKVRFVAVKTPLKFTKNLNFLSISQDGRLRQLDPSTGNLTDLPFNFQISSSQAKNQQNYEALGEAITDYVYELMDQNGLTRHYFPESVPTNDATFIFSTFKELKPIDKLMVIIHGSGVVRAGQWARSLIINDSIHSGTVLPYVKLAQSRGYEVIITNTNDNYRNDGAIKGSESPERHAETVWKKFIQPSSAEKIAIVAHSYGGIVTTQLATKFREEFTKKVFAVAFTDSVHGSRGVDGHLAKVGVNFVTSNTEVNKVLSKSGQDVERRSAGTVKHEMTSYACMEKLFEFLDEKEKQLGGGRKDEM